MSREYADTKIREALKLCNGNASRARQQIIMLAQDDNKLLNALVKPHIDGIVAYQVERVASGRAELENRYPNDKPSIKDQSFGMDLLRAVASSDVAIFGLEGEYAPRKKGRASKQHIEAIHKLAASRHNKKI